MEGPGVQLIKEKLSFLKGSFVFGVSGNSKIDKEKLLGKELLSVDSVGKQLFLIFEGVALRVHFGMYGSFRINNPKPDKVPRLLLRFNKDGKKPVDLYFYNTSLRFVDSRELNLNHSVDVLSENFDREKALEKIKSDERVISDVLLDQEIFAGIGNIIKNEALFLAKVHPESISSKIPDDIAKDLIDKSIYFSQVFLEHRKKGWPLKKVLLVYNRKFCPLCDSKLKVKYAGRSHRKTFFCEKCQRLYV
jgi:endonuclease-8